MIEPKGTSAHLGSGYAELDGIKFAILAATYGDRITPVGAYHCDVVRVEVEAEIFRLALYDRFNVPGFANEKNPMIFHYAGNSDLLERVTFQYVNGILIMATTPATSFVMVATCEQIRWTNDRRTLNCTDGRKQR